MDTPNPYQSFRYIHKGLHHYYLSKLIIKVITANTYASLMSFISIYLSVCHDGEGHLKVSKNYKIKRKKKRERERNKT